MEIIDKYNPDSLTTEGALFCIVCFFMGVIIGMVFDLILKKEKHDK
jgi:hypothetical protein